MVNLPARSTEEQPEGDPGGNSLGPPATVHLAGVGVRFRVGIAKEKAARTAAAVADLPHTWAEPVAKLDWSGVYFPAVSRFLRGE